VEAQIYELLEEPLKPALSSCDESSPKLALTPAGTVSELKPVTLKSGKSAGVKAGRRSLYAMLSSWLSGNFRGIYPDLGVRVAPRRHSHPQIRSPFTAKPGEPSSCVDGGEAIKVK
jgi:hypothetical protein